jgi:hypothetical protein
MSSSSRKMLQAAAGVGGGAFYPYTVDYSARFNDNDSAHLYRTPSSASNRNTWTISAWVKLGSGVLVNSIPIWGAGQLTGSTKTDRLLIRNHDANAPNEANIEFVSWNGSNQFQRRSVFKLRDFSSWYHIVAVVDTTQSTASDRVKVYVNGVELTEFHLSVNPSQNYNTATNDTVFQSVGSRRDNVSSTLFYYDGYLADVVLVDGAALTPSSFAEDKNGVWVPKDVSGLTFGTNGFLLDFSNSAALGTDVSGNGNNFTSSGLTSSDQMPDTPTNNFPVMNPLFGQGTMKEGNLYASIAGGSNSRGQTSTFGAKTGKWYVEMSYLSDTWTVPRNLFGIVPADQIDTYVILTDGIAYYGDGGLYYPGAVSYGASYGAGDILGIAVDLDNDEITFYKNGVSQGTITAYTLRDTEYLFGNWFTVAATVKVVFNFGQDSTFGGRETAGGNSDQNGIGDFKYAVPSGFLALCTANLPEPTIGPNSDTTSDENFNTVLWTGDGNSSRAITGVGFQPDFTWTKTRSATYGHVLYDAVRGGTAALFINTSTEQDPYANGVISSFDSDGFTVASGSSSNVVVNQSGQNYVAWNWKGNGSGVTNNDGTVTSTVSVNQDAGFSIITYPYGAGSAGHGLGAIPDFLIYKERSPNTNSWYVWHKDLSGSDYFLYLDNTGAESNPYGDIFNLTSTTFGSNLGLTGRTGVAYAFVEVESFSSFGKYTGNGSADGPFIYTGMRPAWILIKRTDASGNGWNLYDNKRDTYNVADAYIQPNTSGAEGTFTTLDILSNGFKIRSTNSAYNTSGATYIYMAFAEMPFKYSVGR